MFAALQSEVLGDEGSAIHYLERMEAAAASKTIPFAGPKRCVSKRKC